MMKRPVLFIFIVTLSSVMGVLAMPQGTRRSFDPFADYAVLLPGQLIAMSPDFMCRAEFNEFLSKNTYCSFAPDDNRFSAVKVMIADGIIETLAFEVRDQALRVGDLIALWGAPHVVHVDSRFILIWHDHHISAWGMRSIQPRNQMDYFVPVLHITFENPL